MLDGSVDALVETHIAGWAADRADLTRHVFVDVFLDGQLTATLRCAIFREDLRQAGLGDGCKGFYFDPSPYLKPGLNRVKVHYSGGERLPHGDGCLTGIRSGTFDALDAAAYDRLLALSQERWKGSEPDAALTWDEIFTGNTFIAALEPHYQFRPEHYVCEIGPGYGRLLRTMLDHGLPFHKYTGVELSEDRVRKLASRFSRANIEFCHADAATVRLCERADLLLCSATFEHLFPDFTSTLKNFVEHNLNGGAAVAVDFIQPDNARDRRSQGFEPRGHAFVRIYSAEEIRQLLAECGIVEVHLEPIVLGQAGFGAVRRIFAFGKTREN